MKKNIILFTGPNTVFLRKDLKAWKEAFVWKHDQMNLLELSSLNRDDNMVAQECRTPGFLGGSRLIILHDIPYSSDVPKKDLSESLESDLVNMIEDIPDTNFVLFVQPKPDKRKKLYKLLAKKVTMKEYPDPTDSKLRQHITSHLPGASSQVVNYIMNIARTDMERGERTIEQIQMYHPQGEIDIQILRDNISPGDLEGKIFNFLDGVLAGDTRRIRAELPPLLGDGSLFFIFAGIMSNLRKTLYAFTFLRQGVSPQSISSSLGIHSFVLQKNMHFMKNFSHLQKLYSALTDLDYQAKTWGISHGTSAEEALRMHFIHIFLAYNIR